MADFRKWFYAFAVVALLAGLTIPASAQGYRSPAIQRWRPRPIVRAEGLCGLRGRLRPDLHRWTADGGRTVVPPG